MQKVVLIILLALTLAAIASVAFGSNWLLQKLTIEKNGTLLQDMNRDGRPDYRETWNHGNLISIEQDSNHDGRFDALTLFNNGEAYATQFDTNYDGRYDYRETWNSNGGHKVEVWRNGHFEAIDLPPSQPEK